MVVADDAPLRATLARWLIADGYGVELAESLKHARQVAANSDIALAIVGPLGPGVVGVDLARELGLELDRVVVIEEAIGKVARAARPSEQADPSDALSEQDVLARVEAALGGTAVGEEAPDPGPLRFEGYTLDPGGRTCHDVKGEEIPLTRAEFSLLLVFARQPGRVLSRDALRRAAAGRGAEPDDRSVDMLISRLRRKIEPDPAVPRMIVTVPGEGYKFTAKPQVAVPSTPAVAAPSFAVVPIPAANEGRQETSVRETNVQDAKTPARLFSRSPPVGSFRMKAIGAAAAALASVAGLVIAFWYPGLATRGVLEPAAPAQKFDAAVIPFVFENVRAQLSNYELEPAAKAIAISREGWGIGSGATDEEAAKTEALERCRERDKGGFCRIYSVGNNVVWSNSMLTLPLPADVRDDGSGMPAITSEDLENIWQTIWHVSSPQIVTKYIPGQNHKALAVALTSFYQLVGRPSRAEAIRTVIERCSDWARAPCLLLSVDGMLTVPVPQSHRITAPFTLAGEREMSEADRQRIAQTYGGKDWRALAKGRSGRWYAVDGLETETAAVDEVLERCRKAEPECILHAIGNWRVGEKLESNPG
jgi:two-component system torCAD operon response regulator TorR